MCVYECVCVCRVGQISRLRIHQKLVLSKVQERHCSGAVCVGQFMYMEAVEDQRLNCNAQMLIEVETPVCWRCQEIEANCSVLGHNQTILSFGYYCCHETP